MLAEAVRSGNQSVTDVFTSKLELWLAPSACRKDIQSSEAECAGFGCDDRWNIADVVGGMA